MKNLCDILKKNNIVSKGIIHIGAHEAQEYEEYLDCGFLNQVWIEANPYFYQIIKNKKIESEKVLIFNELIYDEIKSLKFNLANNGASSSILNFKEHKKYYPNINYDGSIEMMSNRMDFLIENNNIDTNEYNGLVIDVQGVELNVLKSLGKYISCFDFIESEVNVEELYENCSLINDIDDFLKDYNFVRVETDMWDGGSVGWGDALYIKNK